MHDLPADLSVVSGRLRHVVTEPDVATRWGNGLPVLATPVLLWLAEVAAMQALAPWLDEDELSLGAAHDSAHLGPTVLGDTVTVTAVLSSADQRTLVFDVLAEDDAGVVLRGTHSRAVTRAPKFLAAVEARSGRTGLAAHGVSPDPYREDSVAAVELP